MISKADFTLLYFIVSLGCDVQGAENSVAVTNASIVSLGRDVHH